MDVSKLSDIGEVVRRIRKSKGYRLEDLADDNISPATISNIERGHSHVNSKKVHYLVDKLGINMAEVPAILMDQKKELEEIAFQLQAIEALIDMKNFAKAEEYLTQIKLEDSHYFAATWYYLKGRSYFLKEKWLQSERNLNTAISIAANNQDNLNIEAASFLLLGNCCFYKNEIEDALSFVNAGLDTFDEHGERQYIKPTLFRNKVVYLERLKKVNEGLRVIEQAWPYLEKVDVMETLMTFYSTRADLLRMAGFIEEAKKYAYEGLDIARRNKHYDCFFDFWTILGSLSILEKDYIKAEVSFETAMSVRDELTTQEPLTDAYIWQGRMYADQGKWDQALECVGSAIENAEKLNDAPKLAFSLRVIGDFYKTQGTKDKAILHYEKALGIAQKYNYRKIEGQILFRLSQCYKDTNEQEFNRTLRNMYTTQVELQGNREADYYEDAE